MKIKTLLIGSGDFAIPIFLKAYELDFLEVVGIVTQPDKPFGRKQEMKGSPVYEALKSEKDIKFFKPTKFRLEYQEILDKTSPELVLVASYGQILPKEFIEYPKYKALNFHGSILPKLRGAVPVQMAILQGLKETGVTLQTMSVAMDEGHIVSIKKYFLKNDEDSKSLMSELAKLGVEILENELEKYIKGEIQLILQDHNKATYCYKTDLSREKAEISFETDYMLAARMIRACYPDPVAWIKLENGKILRVFKALADNRIILGNKLVIREGKKLFLRLESGTLELKEIQLEGKERRDAGEYLHLAN